MSLVIPSLIYMCIFPGGLFLLVSGMLYQWVDRKLIAQFQNRIGPRWFQPLADGIKLLAKEEITPRGVNPILFNILPIFALAAVFTAGLYVPIAGIKPAAGFQGDLIVSIYLLSMVSLTIGLAGANTPDRFSVIGATRTLTQLFSYEAPFLLALLGPAIVSGSWQISTISAYARENFLLMLCTQPVSFIVAIIGLMGKLELPPFDAPEAETEIVSGAMTEYSGRGLALFHFSKDIALIVGLTLIAAFFMGGIANPLEFIIKTLGLLLLMALIQSLFARLRIDQTVGFWWRFASILALVQILVLVILKSKGVL